MPAIHGASSSPRCALRWARAAASSCIPRSSRSGFPTLPAWFPEFADRINAIQARLFDLLPVVREHTYHPAYRRLVLHQIGLARARAGDDAMTAWRSRTGRTPGLLGNRWCGAAWIRRARQNQEGSAGLLRARHAGDGQAAGRCAGEARRWVSRDCQSCGLVGFSAIVFLKRVGTISAGNDSFFERSERPFVESSRDKELCLPPPTCRLPESAPARSARQMPLWVL